jgi:hypothetical protein
MKPWNAATGARGDPYALPFLHAGDIFLTRGTGLLARLIRWFQRDKGEPKSAVNHVGLIISSAPLDRAVSIEALSRVRLGRFHAFYHGDRSEVAVYRCRRLTAEHRLFLAEEALKYRGRLYGFLKLPAHALGWLLGRRVTKKLLFLDAWPICSWLPEKLWLRLRKYFPIGPDIVGEAFYGAHGELCFGKPTDTVQPDDIWDWCVGHPEQWECIVSLGRI